jgi:DNA-directed RNA polymerase subunit RPC12/RpoP
MKIVCPRCQHRVRPERPSRLWVVALAALVVFFTASVAASSLIGPFIMFAVPFLACLGFAFGPIWEKVKAEPACPKCSRILILAPTPREKARARVRALVESRA